MNHCIRFSRLALAPALCLFVWPAGAQAATVANLVDYATKISKPYNATTASGAALDTLVFSMIAQGYVLTTFTDTTQSTPAFNAASHHVLTKIGDPLTAPSTPETITIDTSMNSGSGFAQTVTISIATSDFTVYQGWIKDLSATATSLGYVLFNLNSLLPYNFRNTTTGKVISVQPLTTANGQGGGSGSSSQTLQVAYPLRYTCTITSH